MVKTVLGGKGGEKRDNQLKKKKASLLNDTVKGYVLMSLRDISNFHIQDENL